MLATDYEGLLQYYLLFIALVSAPGLGAIIYSLITKKRSLLFLVGSLVTLGIGSWLVLETLHVHRIQGYMLPVYLVSPFVPLLCGFAGVILCLLQKT